MTLLQSCIYHLVVGQGKVEKPSRSS